MIFDFVKLAIIIIGTLLFTGIALVFVGGTKNRFLLLGLLAGLCFYSGIGAATTRVDWLFILFYFVFFVWVVIGFYISCSIFLRAGCAFGDNALLALKGMDRDANWIAVIILYLLLSTFPLFYPELCIDRLFVPPAPDLRSFWDVRFTDEEDILERLVRYGVMLLTPFFYVALYRLRYRLWLVVIILLLPLYFQYVAQAYISRGEIMKNLVPVLFAAWFLRPNYRRTLMLSVATITPILLYALYEYQMARLGGVNEAGFAETISLLLADEFSFLEEIAMPLFEAGVRVNFYAYITWIATIPIPKLLTGVIEGARINNEISEIITGSPIGTRGFYVVLPSLVAESLYIYGVKLFWVHGFFCGFITAMFGRFMQIVPQFIFLYCYFVFMVSYILNRGGISSFLPPMVNQLFPFVLFFLIWKFWLNRVRDSV